MYFHIKSTFYPFLFHSFSSPLWNKSLIPNHANYFTISFDFRVVLEKFCFILLLKSIRKGPLLTIFPVLTIKNLYCRQIKLLCRMKEGTIKH